jgi:hypothetical protein
MTEDDVKRILTNPFYCLQKIDPIFCQEHEPLITEEKWIAAAKQFIKQNGAEEFLKHLLANLKDQYISTSESHTRCLARGESW